MVSVTRRSTTISYSKTPFDYTQTAESFVPQTTLLKNSFLIPASWVHCCNGNVTSSNNIPHAVAKCEGYSMTVFVSSNYFLWMFIGMDLRNQT